MGEYLPHFQPGQAVTYTASADVVGGQLVEVTGDRTVAPAAAGSVKVAGVAGFDAKAGRKVTVYSGGVQKVTASGVIAAGDQVAAAAAGKANTGTTAPIGVAISPAADGALASVLMNR